MKPRLSARRPPASFCRRPLARPRARPPPAVQLLLVHLRPMGSMAPGAPWAQWAPWCLWGSMGLRGPTKSAPWAPQGLWNLNNDRNNCVGHLPRIARASKIKFQLISRTFGRFLVPDVFHRVRVAETVNLPFFCACIVLGGQFRVRMHILEPCRHTSFKVCPSNGGLKVWFTSCTDWWYGKFVL